MTNITVTLPQVQALLAALRNSTKQFRVTYRVNGSQVTFRSRFSAAPSPVPVDDAQNFHFYRWCEEGQPDAICAVPVDALVSLTINSTEYVLA